MIEFLITGQIPGTDYQFGYLEVLIASIVFLLASAMRLKFSIKETAQQGSNHENAI